MNAAVLEQSHEVLAHHGRTFHLASHLLPLTRRDDAAVVYSFCRQVDDLADEAPDPDVAHQDLGEVQSELQGGRPARPWVGAFLEVAERCGINLRIPEILIEAVLGDLGVVRVADDDELRRYCYGVAGTVGLMMCGVLGVRDQQALPRAVDLGLAMQISNICRDVREDAGRGRVYVPETRLRAVGLEPEDLLRGALTPEQRTALQQATRDLLQLGDLYYTSSELGLRAIPMPARGAILVASRVYREIGVRLQRHHQSDPWHGRTVVPIGRRVSLALRSILEVMFPRFWPGPVPRLGHSLHGGLEGLPGLEG